MINPVKLAAGPQIKWEIEKKSLNKVFKNTKKKIVAPSSQNSVVLIDKKNKVIKPFTDVMNKLQINLNKNKLKINNLNEELKQRINELKNLPKTFFQTKKQKNLKETIASIMQESSTLRDLKQQLERQFQLQEQGGN